jgi:hypothetical protein
MVRQGRKGTPLPSMMIKRIKAQFLKKNPTKLHDLLENCM